MLEMGLGMGENPDQEDGAGDDLGSTVQGQLKLVVEQVKVTDPEGSMKVVYPSRADLDSPVFKVTRDYE